MRAHTHSQHVKSISHCLRTVCTCHVCVCQNTKMVHTQFAFSLQGTHGLSRKFLNVQNSPPLRRPSGARQVLLSSSESDELRRENRIALSYLVIVLCFFKWSHVWRIWRISWDKKMSVFHEQRICVKIGKSVTEKFEMLKIAFREEAMCRTQIDRKSVV